MCDIVMHRSLTPTNKWDLYDLFMLLVWTKLNQDIISYPLFADADTGIYPHAASQYHARPKAKRGIAMLSVDKFPYPRSAEANKG